MSSADFSGQGGEDLGDAQSPVSSDAQEDDNSVEDDDHEVKKRRQGIQLNKK